MPLLTETPRHTVYTHPSGTSGLYWVDVEFLIITQFNRGYIYGKTLSTDRISTLVVVSPRVPQGEALVEGGKLISHGL